MKVKIFIIGMSVFCLTVPALYGEMLSGDLITKEKTFLVVKDESGTEHRLRFDKETTFTVLMDSKETRVKEDIQIEPGASIMAFEDEGYAVYFQLLCKSAGGNTACVPANEK